MCKRSAPPLSYGPLRWWTQPDSNRRRDNASTPARTGNSELCRRGKAKGSFPANLLGASASPETRLRTPREGQAGQACLRPRILQSGRSSNPAAAGVNPAASTGLALTGNPRSPARPAGTHAARTCCAQGRGASRDACRPPGPPPLRGRIILKLRPAPEFLLHRRPGPVIPEPPKAVSGIVSNAAAVVWRGLVFVQRYSGALSSELQALQPGGT